MKKEEKGREGGLEEQNEKLFLGDMARSQWTCILAKFVSIAFALKALSSIVIIGRRNASKRFHKAMTS